MTSVLCLQALSRFLQQVTKDYQAAQGENGGCKPPKIMTWNLPFKNPRAPEKVDFPYIVPRIIRGEDTRNNLQQLSSSVRIDLYFGVYAEGTKQGDFTHPDGTYDLINLMEHVRVALLKQDILDNKYKLQLPYTWDIPEEQPYPLWVGQAQTNWAIQSIIPEEPAIMVQALKFDWEK